jgi:hydroxyacylglutathione hydrolase
MPPPTDQPALEDELGDVLEKAARNVPLTVENLAAENSRCRPQP